MLNTRFIFKSIFFVVLFGIIVADLSNEWNEFKQKYNKQYKTIDEELERKQIFIENFNEIHSFQQNNPHATYTLAINHFSDRRIQELVSSRKNTLKSYTSSSFKSSREVNNLPESLDWRDKGVITEVYHGEVGVIVTAVVSTELVESLHAIKTGELIEGSIPQVYDCCRQPIDAFDCIKNMSGICRKEDYPKPLGRCQRDICKPFASFDTIKRMAKPDENEMLEWIQESTLWAEMSVAGKGFNTYTGGIYDDPSCSNHSIDDVVQIIGYGSEEGKPYWLCKLHWGTGWGEKGYFRIARGKNMCKIADVIIQVANTEPSSTTQISTSTTTQLSTSTTTQPSTSSTTQSSMSTSTTTQVSTSTSSATQLYTISSIHLMVIFVMVTVAQTILICN
ncbi:unnamed protein product [Adineta steineri]|uniref:Peptidase C1A papain C-terminal domain-containing protein n=1 Tax=Adineta steineri TaxID=433720 RepID=A0A816G9W2_9BILA|nr:unnamed protein product [Adineta steineri]CAF1671464.1 unnamed protein product [Adineta steineri]